MKIRAFQIRNYRSIVDTGKCYLSYDNITALIGQNESGKTSVLEALRSFYKGQITDDVLRSDQSFPEIACVFELEAEKLEKEFRMKGKRLQTFQFLCKRGVSPHDMMFAVINEEKPGWTPISISVSEHPEWPRKIRYTVTILYESVPARREPNVS